MWCSAAVDVLFLIDGSHSIGKGSFERAKHFAITVCDALDINPERVSARLNSLCTRLSLVASDSNPVLCRRGHFLACGSGRSKRASPGSRYGGLRGPVPFSPALSFAFLGYLPPWAGFPHVAKSPCIVLQAGDPSKKQVHCFLCRSGRSPGRVGVCEQV